MSRTAAALVIGNEILSGKVQDANTQALALELRALGVELRRVWVVPDEHDVIAEAVNTLRAGHDLLFTSGGVGPTHDDITIASVARAFGRRVVRHPHMESLLRAYYGARITEAHLQMADVVEGTELLFGDDPKGWPAFVLENVIVLPGIPELFRAKLTAVRSRIRGTDAAFVLRNVYVRADEGSIKPLLDQVVAAHPRVMVGSYPTFRDAEYAVRVTFDGRDESLVRDAASSFVRALPDGVLVRADV